MLFVKQRLAGAPALDRASRDKAATRKSFMAARLRLNLNEVLWTACWFASELKTEELI